MGYWGLEDLGLSGCCSSPWKALVSCMMVALTSRRLLERRDAFAGDSRSRITSGGSALSFLYERHLSATCSRRTGNGGRNLKQVESWNPVKIALELGPSVQ